MSALKQLALCLMVSIISYSCYAEDACPPQYSTKATLLNLRENHFSVGDTLKVQQFALSLLPCLQSTDPVLRDQIAYEALSHWMREKVLTTKTAILIFNFLSTWLESDFNDPNGVAKPFAVLVLAEVARMDRIETFLNDQQRQHLVNKVGDYLTGVTDYRGFDEEEGWRHGVAHSADLILQLSLNEAINAGQLEQLANTIVIKVVPDNEHFYRYGEGRRLARALFYLARRNEVADGWWKTWFQKVTSATDSQANRTTQVGLARQHNLSQFLAIFYVLVAENGSEEMKQQLLPLISSGLAELG